MKIGDNSQDYMIKNGNEIYEGDIVKINNEETMYCRYNEGYGTFEFTRSEKLLGHTVEGLFRRYDVSTLIFEVIGNVWEDKELLKPRKIEEQEVLVSENPEMKKPNFKYIEYEKPIYAHRKMVNRASLEEYEEQDKIIELMAFELSTEDENYLYRSIDDIIECFKKKAKGD